MINSNVNFSKKGQLKVQQMAFVLVAIVLFFIIVGIIFSTIWINGIRESAKISSEESAESLIKKISGSPEFSSTQCENCIDLDKVLVLRNRASYKGFWNFDYLAIERIYPKGEGECFDDNFQDCNFITIIPGENFGKSSGAFVSLCRWEREKYIKCELGKIHASGGILNG